MYIAWKYSGEKININTFNLNIYIFFVAEKEN